MKKVSIKALRGDEWEIDGKVVLREGKVYKSKNETWRLEVIQLYHGVPVAGYEGK